MSNKASWRRARVAGFGSGTRWTIRRPAAWSGVFLDGHAAKSISANSAAEIQVPESSSQIAWGYLMAVHAVSGIRRIASLTGLVILTVTDISAPARRAAAVTSAL